jgi:hypothetical protein
MARTFALLHDSTFWRMLFPAMTPIPRLSRLLIAFVAVPALAGCSALGLPQLPGTPLTPVSPEVFDASPQPGASPAAGTVASADGYSLAIPAGWSATDLSGEDGFALADLLASIEPTLGSVARQGLEADGTPHLSLAAVDQAADAQGTYGPAVLVASMRTRGMEKGAARNLVESLLGQATLATDFDHTVESLPAGNAHRYQALVVTDSGVTVQLEVYVLRVGGDSFLVAAVAPEDRFASARPAFEAIIRSLRFGV